MAKLSKKERDVLGASIQQENEMLKRVVKVARNASIALAIISYNDDAFVRELYDAPGIQIEAVTRLNNIKQRYDPNCQFAEVFIANYDMTERQRAATQLNLFDFGQEI